MKKRFSVILALVILALAVIQLPLAAYADITMVEVTKGASIRSKPGYDGDKLTLAKAGEQYLHLGTEGSWYALQMQDGRTGYLQAGDRGGHSHREHAGRVCQHPQRPEEAERV